MKKRLPILLLGLLAAGAGVPYYNRLHHSDRLTFTGFVEGEEKVIKRETAGRVETVTLNDGSRMQTGDPLAEVDARDYRPPVAQQQLHPNLLNAKPHQTQH